MATTLDPSNLIAGLALLLSIYATAKTIQFNNRQQSLIESQEKLNRILLEKEAADSAAGKKADLGASILKLGSNNYRLKIWNKGKAPARNVILDLPEGNEFLSESEIEQKFPLEVLDAHQSVELMAVFHMESKPKHAIRLIWADGHTDRNEKTLYVTL